jgi:hypothetical protein
MATIWLPTIIDTKTFEQNFDIINFNFVYNDNVKIVT